MRSMTNAYLLVPVLALLSGGTVGYLFGRYQATLLNKIRTLEGQRREPVKAPVKPTVITSAYQPPRDIGTAVDSKHKAGIVATKTPERLEWEFRQELEKNIQTGGTV